MSEWERVEMDPFEPRAWERTPVEEAYEAVEEGRKYDAEKPRFSLIPPAAIEEVVRVLTFGAAKYDDHNYLKVENLEDRYRSALLRHVFADMRGERLDSETGLSHLAHAACCLLFILEHRSRVE